MNTQAVTRASSDADFSRYLEWVARTGYAARGVVYVLVGGLALLSAVGMGGSTEDSKGALSSVMDSPGGWVLLVIIGIGLLGYATWRFLQGTLDTDRHGDDAKAWLVRGGLVISGITHVFLGVWAIRRAVGNVAGGSEGSSRESWTAWLLEQPLGQWMVGAVGVAIIGAGIAQAIKGWKEKFKDRLDTSEQLVHKLSPVCRFGLIARGVAFAIIGSFFIYAAWTYDPSQAGGLKQAFDMIRSVAFGQILLGVMALGLLSFAVYSFIEAWYRKIDTPA